MSDQPNVKRWTAKRETAAAMDIMKGKTTAAEVARQHDLTVSEVERWYLASTILAGPASIKLAG